ncbi:MAG: SHOCT domain-containing protein [Faecalibacterium sp.]|jgi:hypothetical protein|nr:SHOCT domain-containing protein [Faecalibacterium sp.]
MGLFSNNKKLCPLCGSPTPMLLATKVAGMPLCKVCAAKIDLPDGLLEAMTVDSFREYMTFYDENQPLRASFTENFCYDFGLLSGELLLDTEQSLFRLKRLDTAIVFPAASLKGFRILEDNRPLFESAPGALRVYASDVPARVNAMAPQIAQMVMQQREYERMERMERMRAERERRDGGNPPPPPPRPILNLPEPVRAFHVELRIDNPYWKNFHGKRGGPTFNSSYPSADSYLNDYQQEADALYTLAENLMHIIDPAAGEVRADEAAAAAPAPVDTVNEIQKYKTLLDAGAITEEEFAAKKRQLLGI